jgi:hypothetical protein
MINTQLVQSLKGALLPDATARNHEQAPAYALPDLPFQMLTALELSKGNWRRSRERGRGRWCVRTRTPSCVTVCSRLTLWQRR